MTPNTQYSIEILKSLRGRRSARSFSQSLGLSTNTVSRWENGYSSIEWYDFIIICSKIDVPLSAILSRYLLYSNDSRDLRSLIQFLSTNQSPSLISKDWNVSKSTLSRWYKKEKSPPLDLVFDMIKKRGLPLSAVLNSIVKASKRTKKLTKIIEDLAKENDIFMEHPSLFAIFTILLLEEFAGKSQTEAIHAVSKRLNLSVNFVDQAVQRMQSKNILKWSIEKKDF